MRFLSLISIFLIVSSAAFSQSLQPSLLPVQSYQQNYFQWPINATKALAANFGELRPNHYHMGLDCRSDQAVNKDIYAAAEGYVAKVKVEPWGFGQAIYVNHPNGMTTLYAHLNSFYPELARYIKQKQYEKKSWEIYEDIPAGLFKVAKGQVIAKSGNTGGSMGPHLHFEIRDTKTDKVLNPLLMGFPIADNAAPDILRLAVYDRCLSTYEQSPKIYALKKIGNKYVLPSGPLYLNTEKVSFAVTAWDRYTGSSNQNGIYQAELYEDGRPVSGFQLNNIGYDETRYLNANIDYKTRSSGGPWLQHLSKLPGYNTGVYVTDESDGVVSLEKGIPKKMSIVVSDANNNKSIVDFTIQMNSINETNTNDVSDKAKQFHPGFINVFENEDVRFYLPEKAIYDSFSFRFKKTPSATGSPIFQIHTATVPLQQYYTLFIRNRFPLTDTGKIVMKRSWGAKKDFSKAVYADGWYSSRFREFGNMQLLYDTVAPVITPVGFYNNMNAKALSRIVLTVTDNSEDLEKFEGYLDGKWIMFTNDKGRNFIYNFDEHCGPGPHELDIRATDLVGNITAKKYSFTR